MIVFKPLLYILYRSTLDTKKLAERTIELTQYMDDNTKKKKQVYMVPPDAGLEEVLYCIEIFKQRAIELDFDASEYFENFGSLVEGTYNSNYKNAKDAGPHATMADFHACMHRFVLNYCKTTTKEDQYNNFTTAPQDYKKDLKASVRAHANRLREIQGYVNALPPANEYKITELQLKKLLLKSCPPSWEKDFAVSGGNLDVMTFADLINWLENLKSHADREYEEQQTKKRSRRNGRTGRNGSKRRKRNDSDSEDEASASEDEDSASEEPEDTNHRRSSNRHERGSRASNQRNTSRNGTTSRNGNTDSGLQLCRQHGIHPWKFCPSNWNSPYYDPNYVHILPGQRRNGPPAGNYNDTTNRSNSSNPTNNRAGRPPPGRSGGGYHGPTHQQHYIHLPHTNINDRGGSTHEISSDGW
jgi:hypothetical protein